NGQEVDDVHARKLVRLRKPDVVGASMRVNKAKQNPAVFVSPGAHLSVDLGGDLPEPRSLRHAGTLRQRHSIHERFGAARAEPQGATLAPAAAGALEVEQSGGHCWLRHAPARDALVRGGRLALLDLLDQLEVGSVALRSDYGSQRQVEIVASLALERYVVRVRPSALTPILNAEERSE